MRTDGAAWAGDVNGGSAFTDEPVPRASLAMSFVNSAIRSSGSSFWPVICCGFADIIGSAL
jgi:hypothetical protein